MNDLHFILKQIERIYTSEDHLTDAGKSKFIELIRNICLEFDDKHDPFL